MRRGQQPPSGGDGPCCRGPNPSSFEEEKSFENVLLWLKNPSLPSRPAFVPSSYLLFLKKTESRDAGLAASTNALINVREEKRPEADMIPP